MSAYCTACGAPRPLSTVVDAVNVAGQPARVGGGVAGVLGLTALTIGLILTLVLGGFAYAFFATLWVGGAVLFLTLAVSLPLILGGRRLQQAGQHRARTAMEQAVFALAARRRGVLSVRDVARALSVPEVEADALLTELAKRPDGRVTLELDDNGGITYLFQDLLPSPAGRVRIASHPWQAPTRVAPATPEPRVIDAELIEEDEARSPVRHASR